MERFDFGLQEENTPSTLCGGWTRHLTFIRAVLLDGLNLPFLPRTIIDPIKLVPALPGWKPLLQPSLLDASEFIPPWPLLRVQGRPSEGPMCSPAKL